MMVQACCYWSESTDNTCRHREYLLGFVLHVIIYMYDQVDDEEVEPISDSGRIFVRNLPHVCTEEDLEALFNTYGIYSCGVIYNSLRTNRSFLSAPSRLLMKHCLNIYQSQHIQSVPHLDEAFDCLVSAPSAVLFKGPNEKQKK